jgi:hypothetical protein
MSDAETWRAVLEDGSVREAAVTRRDHLGRAYWRAESGAIPMGESFTSARHAVVNLASFSHWPVVEILAPGQLTRAEVEADTFRRGAEAMREACADLCDGRAVNESSNALQFAANAIRALPLPEVTK